MNSIHSPILKTKGKRGKPGACYAISYHLFIKHPLRYSGTIRLVHGVCTLVRPPFDQFGHAWIEEKIGESWFARDPKFPDTLFPVDDYYRRGKVSYRVTYSTPAQVRKLANDSDSLGPWDSIVAAARHAPDEE